MQKASKQANRAADQDVAPRDPTDFNQDAFGFLHAVRVFCVVKHAIHGLRAEVALDEVGVGDQRGSDQDFGDEDDEVHVGRFVPGGEVHYCLCVEVVEGAWEGLGEGEGRREEGWREASKAEVVVFGR